jgi:hypothetical protein
VAATFQTGLAMRQPRVAPSRSIKRSTRPSWRFNFYFNEEAANPVIANVLFAILHRPPSLTSEKKLT